MGICLFCFGVAFVFGFSVGLGCNISLRLNLCGLRVFYLTELFGGFVIGVVSCV